MLSAYYRFFRCLLIGLGCWIPFAAVWAGDGTSQTDLVEKNIHSIHVVSDENFPPYLFRNADGKVEGYLVELWALWEKKTGIKVQLTATQWAEAQQMLQAGKADVIDMIYRTSPREKIYDFSAPYADLPVMIYHQASIGGISDVSTLKGFQIGVQSGDACIDQLREHGISTIVQYTNYEALINAAQRQEVKVFCLDL